MKLSIVKWRRGPSGKVGGPKRGDHSLGCSARGVWKMFIVLFSPPCVCAGQAPKLTLISTLPLASAGPINRERVGGRQHARVAGRRVDDDRNAERRRVTGDAQGRNPDRLDDRDLGPVHF